MNTEQLLEQLFDEGFATKEVKLGQKYTAVIKNLSAQDYIDMDPLLSNLKGTKLFVLQSYGLAKLSRAVIKFKDTEFTDPEAALVVLKLLPAALVDKLLKEHTTFEKEINAALNPEVIDENFFVEAGSAEKLEQSQKD
jgi:hypothetical protein